MLRGIIKRARTPDRRFSEPAQPVKYSSSLLARFLSGYDDAVVDGEEERNKMHYRFLMKLRVSYANEGERTERGTERETNRHSVWTNGP